MANEIDIGKIITDFDTAFSKSQNLKEVSIAGRGPQGKKRTFSREQWINNRNDCIAQIEKMFDKLYFFGR